MKFTKMHGCGNDYVYVNCFEEHLEDPNGVSKYVSDRHFGIGSDGLICIHPSDQADFRMAMYNADGSEGAMCGNGIRCVAKYVYDHGMTDQTKISIETKAGIKYLDLFTKDGKVEQVTVDMGAPITRPSEIPAVPAENDEIILDEPILIAGEEYHMTAVSMGNPHTVVFVADTKAVDIEKIGPLFENHVRFPDRVNTEFIHVIDRHAIDMRVWERGSGETLACGTGTCAAVYACILNGYTDDEVLVHVIGGDLRIRYDREKHTIFMTGPAVTVFEGEIELP
ncbi:diaminopimelate epimerase [Clostridium sp. SY8519]|uniref:diaminopimelate epimerase n=1 Tax=Clostridium sp. (strain SY8519) TaxID=1042156 RepID=UPI00021713AF|nr:diaminopimelate epimerase [Clostridium sp. SY8519]BAK46072.1 diaminopimelate epimerase [Clostridium sp. SY8519]